jgi:chromosome segregation ATPase
MAFCKRFFGLLAFVVGLVGLLGCIAVLGLAGANHTRLQKKTTQVFAELDQFLLLVDGRLVQTQKRVNTAKLTTKTIEQTLQGWTTRESRRLLSHRLEVVEKTQYLASALEQADEWLVFSESVVELAKRGLSLGQDRQEVAKSIDRLVADLALLRGQIEEAQKLVADLRERIHELDDEESVGERVEQAAKLVLRVIATLGVVDTRLADIRTNVSQTQIQLQEFNGTVRQWITWGVVAVGVLSLWMAAGQVALSLFGWRGVFHRAATRESR